MAALLSGCAGGPTGVEQENRQGAERSLAKWSRAIERNPENAVAYSNRSAVKYRLRDYQGALADADRAILLKPSDAIAHANRAAAKLALGDSQGALDDARESLRLDSSLDAARDVLAVADQRSYRVRGPYWAQQEATRTIQLVPNDARAYVTRSLAKLVGEDSQGAVDDAAHAINLDPMLAMAYTSRSLARHTLGDHQGAAQDRTTADHLRQEVQSVERRKAGQTVQGFQGEDEILKEAGPAARDVSRSRDYSHLINALMESISASLYYPEVARTRGWTGQVLVRATIAQNGEIMDAFIVESSGHAILDHNALLIVWRSSPVLLGKPLDQSIVVQIPIAYRFF